MGVVLSAVGTGKLTRTRKVRQSGGRFSKMRRTILRLPLKKIEIVIVHRDAWLNITILPSPEIVD